jgi:hypothetical protein
LDVESTASFEQTLSFQNNTDAADRCLAVLFTMEEVEDKVQTAAQGRPIFKSVEFCEIQVPGDRDCISKDRVTRMQPDPRLRFPAAYAKFKAGHADQLVGTPLIEWGPMPRSTAKSYAAVGIHTVEQLAGLSDGNAQSLRGSIEDRTKARDFLETSKGQAPLTEARAEMARMRDEMAALREQIRELGGAPSAAPSPPTPKRKPGRPRKTPQPEV